MLGGVYENKSGKGARWIVKFPGVYRRFEDRGAADRFLTGLRFKSDEGVFDPRDYQKDNPLGLETLAREWLTKKETEGLKCPSNLSLHMGKVSEFFQGNPNIKTINTREVEKFRSWLLQTSWSSKYRSCILTTFHSFLKWVSKVEPGFDLPEVEPIAFEMRMRNILDKDTQQDVLDEVKRLTWHLNPKIYIACLWLSTYVTARPIELLSVVESDIDADAGVIRLRRNKEGRDDKRLYLVEDDITYLRTLPKSIHPDKTYFFRHSNVREGLSRRHLGRFGKKLVYKWWKKSCKNLGILDVDLYGGTRHSSASDLGKYYTPEEVMHDGTGHATSKSFLRYFHIRAEKKKAVATTARRGETLVKLFDTSTSTVSLPK
jgi:integrase